MPYAQDIHGVYRLTNTVTKQCYVGGSKRVRKRVAEHFRLLRQNIHPNPKLQESFNAYGEDVFKWDIEVQCEDPADLDSVEEAFLSGEARFPEPVFFNISTTAKMPMANRKHSDETRKRISESKRKNMGYVADPEYRAKLKEAHRNRFFSDEKFVEKIKFLVDNPHLTYAERGRRMGIATSSARRLALKYANLRGKL